MFKNLYLCCNFFNSIGVFFCLNILNWDDFLIVLVFCLRFVIDIIFVIYLYCVLWYNFNYLGFMIYSFF